MAPEDQSCHLCGAELPCPKHNGNDDFPELETIRPTGDFDTAEALRLRVQAAADQILKLVPDSLAAMVERAERETAARRALGGIA